LVVNAEEKLIPGDVKLEEGFSELSKKGIDSLNNKGRKYSRCLF
jgi:hypothetical protein